MSAPSECKKVVRDFLTEHQLPFTKLTARTIDFTDLARTECVFVNVHGWEPSPKAEELDQLARANGFRVQFAGFPS